MENPDDPPPIRLYRRLSDEVERTVLFAIFFLPFLGLAAFGLIGGRYRLPPEVTQPLAWVVLVTLFMATVWRLSAAIRLGRRAEVTFDSTGIIMPLAYARKIDWNDVTGIDVRQFRGNVWLSIRTVPGTVEKAGPTRLTRLFRRMNWRRDRDTIGIDTDAYAVDARHLRDLISERFKPLTAGEPAAALPKSRPSPPWTGPF